MARRSFGNLRKLPSGRWQASYTDDIAGKRIAAPSTFGTKADAALWLSTIEADRARGHLLDQRLATRRSRSGRPTGWPGSMFKPKTEVSYESSLRNHVLPVFQHRPVGSITYRDCKAFVDGLRAKGLAAGTAGEARKVVRLVLQEALSADAIRRNPADGLRVQ